MRTAQDDKNDLEASLLAAIHQISLAGDLAAALAALVEQVEGLVPGDGMAAMWLNGDQLEVLASRGDPAPLAGLTLPVSQVGCARAVLDAGRPVLIDDTSGDARWRPTPGEEDIRAWLGVPLLLDGRPIGLLEWTAREPRWFDADDVSTGAALARHAAPILHRIQLLEDTRHRLRELAEPPAAPAPDTPDVATRLQRVVREALDYTRARHAFVFLSDSATLRLRCVAAAGDQRERLRTVILRGDGTLGGWSPPARRPAEWAGGTSDREVMAALGILEPLILPLRVGKQPVGMLGVADPREGRAFSQDSIRLMTHLASQASLIVENVAQSHPPGDPYDYEMVFQSCPLGLCVLSAAGQIRAANPALAALLSRSDRRLVGHSLSEFLGTADWRRLLHALEEVAITGQRQQVDTAVRSAQGEQRHVRLSLAPAAFGHVPGERGGPGQALVAVVEDITWLKVLEQERVDHLRELREKHQQLQELDQLRTRFVSNVSHELRTPLAVIKLYATLTRKGRPEKQSYYLQTIEQETHRLETMVENVLDLTRIDRQTLRLHPEWLASEEIIAQVLEVYQETAQKHGIELRNHVQGDLPRLWADKNDLIQMLTNLVDNGLKYTPRGGQVWVAAREFQSDGVTVLEIAVGDTGPGVPEVEQGRIFERFYRGSNNPAGSTGTGLGLAIVQELMAQHGGQVTLKSRVGEGSVFALQFPITHQPPAGARNEEGGAKDGQAADR